MSTRDIILHNFALWTASSATRSFSRERVCRALSALDFDCVLSEDEEPINKQGFDCWHEAQVDRIRELDEGFSVGWAAKIINVYLKTQCYVGGRGRPQLLKVIHPPIDGILVKRLRCECREMFKAPEFPSNFTIKGITTYDCYKRMIRSCRCFANRRGCTLLELEQYWEYYGESRT